MGIITDRVKAFLSGIPGDVTVVAAAKSRSADEVREAIDAGIRYVGENYVQEARAVIETLGGAAAWHFIGHLQKNKVKYAVRLFDMIQTVDSVELAVTIDRLASQHGRVMPVLIEVNSGREETKHGAMPENVPDLVRCIAGLPNISIKGLMTMGPFVEDPERLRPFFRATKQLFDEIQTMGIPGVDMEILSMGMSDSYRIAVEEGATMVRIGTLLFGERT